MTVTDSQYRQKVCTARTAEEIFVETIAVKTRILNDRVLLEAARAIGDRLIAGYRAGARVFMCGNGGSAADAQHFAAELTGHLIFDRPPLGAEALHANSSHLTAVANDYDYDTVFARALEGSARPGDTLFCDKYLRQFYECTAGRENRKGVGCDGCCNDGRIRRPAGRIRRFLDQRPVTRHRANPGISHRFYSCDLRTCRTRAFRASPIGKPILTRPFERWSRNVRDTNGVSSSIETGSSIDKWSATTYGTGGSLNGCPGRRGR